MSIRITLGDSVSCDEYRVSDDRRTLTMLWHETEGTREVAIGWNHPATPQELAYALENSENARTENMQPGQRSLFIRRQLPFGVTAYVGIHTGPPTWWLPKVQVRKRTIGVGWLRHAFTVGVLRKW